MSLIAGRVLRLDMSRNLARRMGLDAPVTTPAVDVLSFLARLEKAGADDEPSLRKDMLDIAAALRAERSRDAAGKLDGLHRDWARFLLARIPAAELSQRIADTFGGVADWPVPALIEFASKHRRFDAATRAAVWARIRDLPTLAPRLQARLLGGALADGERDAAARFAWNLRANAAPGTPFLAQIRPQNWLEMAEAFLAAGCHDLAAEACREAGRHAGTRADLTAARLAAVALARGDVDGAAAQAEAALADQRTDRPPLLDLLLRHIHGGAQAEAVRSMPPRVSLAVFTNVTSKLRVHKALGAPGTGLIRETLGSLRHALSMKSALSGTIFLDKRDGDVQDAYAKGIAAVAEEFGLDLVVNPGLGLRRQWLMALDRAETPALFMLEHDWRFSAASPTMASLMRLLALRPDINFFRFNKRQTIVAGRDGILCQQPLDRLSCIVRTSGYSNNPHIVRTAFARDVLSPLLRDNARLDGVNAGAGGVEENLWKHFAQLAKVLGAQAALHLTGLAIIGQMGDARLVEHIGR